MNNSAEPVYPVAQHRWRRILFAMALAIVAGVVLYFYTCSRSGRSPCTTCPPSSLRPKPSCAKTHDAPRRDPSHIDMPGARPPDPRPGDPGAGSGSPDIDEFTMPNNGLSPAALAYNTALLDALKNSSLAHDLLTAGSPAGERVRLALLANGHGPELLEYVASCALDPCEYVRLPDGDALAASRRRFPDGFPGELGLCSTSYNAWATTKGLPAEPPWTAGTPTPACQERVSACVLARVNAVGARVSLSMRGDGRNTLSKVAVETQFRANHGTPIQSFKPCDKMCLWGDPKRRNCDWEPRYVGQCVRGQDGSVARKVRLKLGAGTTMRVRICKGLYGCDDSNPALGAGAATAPVFFDGRLVEFPAYYGGEMIDYTSSGTAIEFDCPANGPAVSDAKLRTGYYSVMLGTRDPAIPVAPGADVVLEKQFPEAAQEPFATHDAYPASEDHVFTYREGGFFGSIFTPMVTSTTCPTEQILSGDQFVCHSDTWTVGAAIFADRLCAGPTGVVSQCFANPPGPCDPSQGTAACTREPPGPPAPIVYDACSLTPPKWEHPYTTYLNHPCDLFADDQTCAPFLAIRGVQIRKPPGTVSNIP